MIAGRLDRLRKAAVRTRGGRLEPQVAQLCRCWEDDFAPSWQYEIARPSTQESSTSSTVRVGHGTAASRAGSPVTRATPSMSGVESVFV